MKYALIIAGVVVGLVLTLVVLGTFTHIFDNHERVGNFDIYSNPKIPDSSVQSALYYKRYLLAERLNDYSVDPNNADRILFSSDDVFHGAEGRCGTFLYDGRSDQLSRIHRGPVSALWSPNSQFILLDRASRPLVLELLTGREIELADFVSSMDGSRVALSVFQWSPDSQRLAGELGVSPDKRGWDRDLVEITIAPAGVRYIATIRNSSLVWTERQVRWNGGGLQLSARSTSDRPIVVKGPDVLGWTTTPPTAPPRPFEEFPCSAIKAQP